MGKRFTESSKWDDKWFRRLPPDQKFGWLYLLDTCDAAGVVEIDEDLAEFRIGLKVDWPALFASAGSRLIALAKGKHWLSGFIEFQYGRLSPDCKAHRPVFASLEKHGITERVLKGYPKGTTYPQGQYKDKDKSKSIELEGDCKGETTKPFDAWWAAAPRKVGRKAAESAYNAAVKALAGVHDDVHAFLLDRIKAFAASPKARGDFCPHPSTWLNQGRYDDDPATWQDAGNLGGNRNGRRNDIGPGQRYDPATAQSLLDAGW